MATEFTLTPQPVGVTGISRQPLDQAVEVTGYDVITALLGALSIEGGSPSVTVEVITGMRQDTEGPSPGCLPAPPALEPTAWGGAETLRAGPTTAVNANTATRIGVNTPRTTGVC